MEEVSIQIKNITYFGSQPWPFPNSLMIGYSADYVGGDIKSDPLEIEDAGYFPSISIQIKSVKSVKSADVIHQ